MQFYDCKSRTYKITKQSHTTKQKDRRQQTLLTDNCIATFPTRTFPVMATIIARHLDELRKGQGRQKTKKTYRKKEVFGPLYKKNHYICKSFIVLINTIEE